MMKLFSEINTNLLLAYIYKKTNHCKYQKCNKLNKNSLTVIRRIISKDNTDGETIILETRYGNCCTDNKGETLTLRIIK